MLKLSLMKYFLTLTLFLSSLPSFAQISKADSLLLPAIVQQGATMAGYFVKEDYTNFAKYTYPALSKMIGGEAQMADMLTKTMEKMKKEGIIFLSCSIDTPSIVIHTPKLIQCLLNENLVMKTTDGKLAAKSSLIGISKDAGKNWYFIDTHGADIKTLQKTIPELSDKLVVPARSKPILLEE